MTDEKVPAKGSVDIGGRVANRKGRLVPRLQRRNCARRGHGTTNWIPELEIIVCGDCGTRVR